MTVNSRAINVNVHGFWSIYLGISVVYIVALKTKFITVV